MVNGKTTNEPTLFHSTKTIYVVMYAEYESANERERGGERIKKKQSAENALFPVLVFAIISNNQTCI